MSSKLQLDVCYHNRWWRHLVNANKVEAGMVLFAGKTVIHAWAPLMLIAFRRYINLRYRNLSVCLYVSDTRAWCRNGRIHHLFFSPQYLNSRTVAGSILENEQKRDTVTNLLWNDSMKSYELNSVIANDLD